MTGDPKGSLGWMLLFIMSMLPAAVLLTWLLSVLGAWGR